MAIEFPSPYERGYDGARRALDASTLNAQDLLTTWRTTEQVHRRKEMYHAAEYAKGFADHLQEFLDDKAN